MPQIGLSGNMSAAAKWIGFAMRKLVDLKRSMLLGKLPSGTAKVNLADAEIRIESGYGLDIIRIKGIGGGVLIIRAIMGTTSRDVVNDPQHIRYYVVNNGIVTNISEGDLAQYGVSQLIDDCSYIVRGESPAGTIDLTDPAGMRIPIIPQETDSIRAVGSKFRIYPAWSYEAESWSAITILGYSQQYLMPAVSLMLFPFESIGFLPFVKYSTDGILYQDGLTTIGGGVYSQDYVQVNQYGDQIPVAGDIYYIPFDITKPSKTFDLTGKCFQQVVMDKKNKQNIVTALLADVQDWPGTCGFVPIQTAEKFYTQTLDIEHGAQISGIDFPGSARSAQACTFFWTFGIGGQLGSVKNTFNIPIGYAEDGKASYVKVETMPDLSQVKQTLYLGDDPVDTLGWLTTIAPSGYQAGVFPVTYRIPYKNLGRKFQAVMFHRAKYVSHSIDTAMSAGQTLVYSGYPNSGVVIGTWKVLSVVTQLEFFVAVNGVVTQIGGPCNIIEKTLFKNIGEINAGISVVEPGALYSSYQKFYWFDTDGIQPYPMRCSFVEAGDKLLFSYDAYPVNVLHELVLDTYRVAPNYDTTAPYKPFPPYTDAYWQPTDRQWWLFDTSGNHKILDTPKILDGQGVPTDVMPNRLVNLTMFSTKVGDN